MDYWVYMTLVGNTAGTLAGALLECCRNTAGTLAGKLLEPWLERCWNLGWNAAGTLAGTLAGLGWSIDWNTCWCLDFRVLGVPFNHGRSRELDLSRSGRSRGVCRYIVLRRNIDGGHVDLRFSRGLSKWDIGGPRVGRSRVVDR